MNKLLLLALAGLSGAACAQTPAVNPMPDGSQDMYVGLGVQSRPRYEGAESQKGGALPVLQMEWSNGLFISGMSAGWHLSRQPTLEYGPLLSLQPGRDARGSSGDLGGVDLPGLPTMDVSHALAAVRVSLSGMTDIPSRVLGGGFVNVYLSPAWRLTGSALYGAGQERDGGKLELGVQRLAFEVAPHHLVSASLGASFVNAHYNSAYFGVSLNESLRTGIPPHSAGGGLKDVHAGLRWNWTLSPSWLLTSSAQVSHLQGDAKASPLVARPTNWTVSTALAYRF